MGKVGRNSSISLSFMLSARFFYLCEQHHKDESIGSYREYAIAIEGEAGDSLT